MTDLAILETSNLRLEFNKKNGSLVTIYSKLSDWYILDRPQLGLSWRMMLPLEDRRNNNAWGHIQKNPPSCEASADCVRFHWSEVDSELGGKHSIAITTECRIENDQTVFRMHIKNDDNVCVENVYYPYIGDLHRPKDANNFSLWHGEYFRTLIFEMWPTFRNTHGTHSVDYPTFTTVGEGNPPMYPFVLASDEKGNGLYMGICERRMESAIWHAEALPGWRNGNDFRLFTEDQAEGYDVHNRFCLGHLPFVAPGTEFELLPLAMEAYTGEWAAGAKCYTKLSKSWNKLPDMPKWAKQPHSWLQVHINSPEDELRMRFTELPKLGAECKKYGVDVIQLVGWNDGGQDRGNPSHEPDSRLGTFEELKQAIKEIRDMGIKLILFIKFTWADESRRDFREIYESLAIKDPYGNYYVHQGYQYQSLSQVADVNTRRLIPMCFHSDAYMDICRREFQKCIDLGADGVLYDENHQHARTLCCFNESHGHRRGENTYAADERFVDMLRSMVKDREFLIAGETSYDFQLNYYDISYGRTWGRDHLAYTRLLRPEAYLMTAVIGFNDRSMINQCLLNRYLISFEPFNFKGLLSDFPKTVTYGIKMDKLRRELREYFWDGLFREHLGGNVEVEDFKEKFSHYSVYDATNGKQGMIICNYDENRAIKVTPSLDSGQVLDHYRLVEDESATTFDGCFIIPPQSAAAVYS